jgi:hypothetical protein
MRERKRLRATEGLPAPTNDSGICIHTDHSPRTRPESARVKTALSIVRCITASGPRADGIVPMVLEKNVDSQL